MKVESVNKLIKMNQRKDRRKLRGILGMLPIVFIALSLVPALYIQAFAQGPDVFAQEAGNEFNYQGTEYGVGPYTLKEIVYLDTITFSPATTYKIVATEDGYDAGNMWFEKGTGVLKLRGLRLWDDEDGWLTFKFSTGLPMAWDPRKQIGYNEYNSTTMLVGDYIFNVGLDVTVLAKEFVTLSFDTLEAYKMKYILTIWGYDVNEQSTFYQWQVPYLGTIKYMDGECEELLTSFKIGGGTITQNTDTDGDGLKDYQELIIYNTNRESSDTDDDKMPDGWEVQYGLNPLANDASLDKDSDGYSNLEEYQAGSDPNDPNSRPSKAMPWIPLLLLDD